MVKECIPYETGDVSANYVDKLQINTYRFLCVCASLPVGEVARLAAPRVSSIFDRPAFTVPFLHRLGADIGSISIIMARRLKLILCHAIGKRGGVLSFMYMAGDFRVSGSCANLCIGQNNRIPKHLLSNHLQNVFRSFIFPFPMVNIGLGLVIMYPNFAIMLKFMRVT